MKRARTSSSTTQQSIHAPNTQDQTRKHPALHHAAQSYRHIQCGLPPHEAILFDDLTSYEAHYIAQHCHRCAECFVNLPSDYLLLLHIDELHNPFQQVRRDAGEKTYKCFVETCDKTCIDWRKRRRHLIDKHGYPRNYDFRVVQDGVDGRYSLLRPGIDEEGHRKSSRERMVVRDAGIQTAPEALVFDGPELAVSDQSGMQGQDVAEDRSLHESNVEDMSAELAALRMVPENISFGRQKGRTDFSIT